MNVVTEEKIGSLHHFCEFNFARLIEPRRRTDHLPDGLADDLKKLVPSLEEIESSLVLSRAPLKETDQRDKDRCASRNNPLNNLHHRPAFASEAKPNTETRAARNLRSAFLWVAAAR